MILKQYLDVNGIKYQHFADKIKVNKMTLNYILKRERELRLSVAMRIVQATNGEVTFEDLIKLEKKAHPKKKTDKK